MPLWSADTCAIEKDLVGSVTSLISLEWIESEGPDRASTSLEVKGAVVRE